MNHRFDRHSFIPGWDQDRLFSSTVIIIGMGALGNEVSRLLAMSGVGNLIICDPDVVEESNLSRMILFGPTDIGQWKVLAAANKLKELFPDIDVEIRPFSLVNGVGLAELRDASLVVGCLDSRAARLQLAGRCQLAKAKYIDGGTHPWGGEVRLYLDPEGPCYGCGLDERDRALGDVPWSCTEAAAENPVGAAIPSSALVGTWLGMMAVRFLMGLECPDGTLRIDGTRGVSVIVEVKRDPDCLLHVPIEKATCIPVSFADTVADLKKVLPKGASPLLWEPVEERVECISCGYSEARWKVPGYGNYFCPLCGYRLRVHTTLELDRAPGEMVLEDLGIPTGEILAVRMKKGIEWYELRKK